MLGSSVPVALAAVAGLVLGLIWIGSLVRFLVVTRTLPVLRPGSHPGIPADPPRVSVIVAAKDEEKNIEACVRSILSQDYPAFDLWVVNDRSTDGTLPILEALAAEFAGRLKVLTLRTLPAGWGGQNHALGQGVAASSGEWLCFTDADCRLDSKRTLTVAVSEARAHGADLLSILPRMEAPTLWERAYLPVCLVVFMMRMRLGEVNDPKKPAAYANGAFLLARRSAYEQLGGHERVRNQVNDDVCLAQIAKREGFRLRLTGNAELCRARMYGSIRQAWSGWTRNFYGTLQTGGNLLAALIATLGFFVLPWVGLLLAAVMAWTVDPRWEMAAWVWGSVAGAAQLGMWLVYPAFGSPGLLSLSCFPAGLLVSAIVGRAMVRAFRKAETVWQGARYQSSPPHESEPRA